MRWVSLHTPKDLVLLDSYKQFHSFALFLMTSADQWHALVVGNLELSVKQ